MVLPDVYLAVGVYSLCSASMLLVNKLVVHHLPCPSFVTLMQFVASALTIGVGSCAGVLSVDAYDWQKVRYFVVYVVAFSLGTWANMKVLMVSNVETVIVFRACTPLVVSATDYVFYRRAAPSPRSALAMALILLGAVAFVAQDRDFEVQGVAAYKWVLVWFSLLTFQLTYGKHLVTGLGLQSIWSPVLYTNSLAVAPTLVLGFVSGEAANLAHVELTTQGIFWLVASCVVGTGISWAGFKCQSVITATAYTVVGVVNKMLTVLINVLIWDQHASARGICALLLCLAGGALYQQAPLRAPPPGAHEARGGDGGAEGLQMREASDTGDDEEAGVPADRTQLLESVSACGTPNRDNRQRSPGLKSAES